jgi:hypothetical protein
MSPEMQALKDYKDGMAADDNPYPAGSDEAGRWQGATNKLWADELQREMAGLTA